LLWRYTWVDILEYLSQIPIERIINIQPGDKKEKINNRYMEAICDKSVKKVDDSQMIDFLTRLNKKKGGNP
jgi:hypothetical protein